MNRCLQGAQVPEWMTKGKTTLIQKDPSKGTAPNNYRPITCLPMTWKILTAQIREKIYYSLTSRGFSPDEHKRCRKGSRGTAELLNIDPKWEQDKMEKSSYGLDWLQKGIWYGPTKLDTTLSQNVQNITWSHKLHRKDHANLETGADSRMKKLSWNKDPKRDFPRRCTIIIAIMPLNHILRKCTVGYKLSRSQEKINHLMYMDDIKLFAKNEKKSGNSHTRC